MIRTNIEILITKEISPTWTNPSNIEKYQENITNNLKADTPVEENVDNLNEEITKKDEKINLQS